MGSQIMDSNRMHVTLVCLGLLIVLSSCNRVGLRRSFLDLSNVPTDPDPYRVAYFMNITVGTSKLEVLIDTGSGNLAVDSVSCVNNGCVGSAGYEAGRSANLYPCQKSSDCSCTEKCTCSHNPGDYTEALCEFGVTYVDGSGWTAVKVTDNVTLDNSYSATNTFGSIQSMSGMSAYYPNNDGTMGFAYGDTLSVTGNCWFEDYVSQSGADAIFSVCMGLTEGWLTIGGMDDMLFRGVIKYTPLQNTGFYSVGLETIEVKSVTSSFSPQTDTISVYRSTSDTIGPILDTGSSGVYLDPTNYEALTSTITQQCLSSGGNWTGICDESSTTNNNWLRGCINISLNELDFYPELIFGFSNGTTVRMSPYHYMVPLGDYSITDQLWCLGIYEGYSGSNINLGDPFLRSTYTIFDLQNQRIGFAPPNPLYCA